MKDQNTFINNSEMYYGSAIHDPGYSNEAMMEWFLYNSFNFNMDNDKTDYIFYNPRSYANINK